MQTAGFEISRVLMGRKGLRAGWRLLIFAIILLGCQTLLEVVLLRLVPRLAAGVLALGMGALSPLSLLVLEVGKSWVEADADVAEGIDFLEYYAREMLRFAQPHPITPIAGEKNAMVYIPLGVGVVIPPWNFAFAILVVVLLLRPQGILGKRAA